MSYLIRTCGIDLAPVSSGVATIDMRVGTWEARLLNAGVVHLNRTHNYKQNTFAQQMSAARRVVEYVRSQSPDLVGLEDYTNQSTSHVGFSMGQLGGLIRLMLWQEGYRQLLIVPARVSKIVIPWNLPKEVKKSFRSKSSGSTKWKAYCVEWVEKHLNTALQGKVKERSDMADAAIYALIAACFFSMYWLKVDPPLNGRQREVFYNRVQSYSSTLTKNGWVPNGLLDTPGQYLIRNAAREAETYTPEWLRTKPNNVIFIGDKPSGIC